MRIYRFPAYVGSALLHKRLVEFCQRVKLVLPLEVMSRQGVFLLISMENIQKCQNYEISRRFQEELMMLLQKIQISDLVCLSSIFLIYAKVNYISENILIKYYYNIFK
jgi:hypothetical protein